MNNPYLQAVDEALVCSHLGVANQADGFDEAKRKVNLLLAHAEGVGEYFARQELDALRQALQESRANDCAAMVYLSEVRQMVGGEDFPDMVRRVKTLWRWARILNDDEYAMSFQSLAQYRSAILAGNDK